METTKPEEGIRVKSSSIFKLKDKPTRQFIVIHLKEFGFIPETIIVEKVRGENNMVIVRAVMTPDAIKEEDKIIAREKKESDKQLQVLEDLKKHGKSKRTAAESQL